MGHSSSRPAPPTRPDARGAELETLVVGPGASEQRLALAADLLERCEAIVIVEGIARLTPKPDFIECAIEEPIPGASRCEEEYRALIENATRALDATRLGAHLPDRPLRWVIVDDDEAGKRLQDLPANA
jgi:hypothetical protein